MAEAHNISLENVTQLISDSTHSATEWTKPTSFDLTDRGDIAVVERLFDSNQVIDVIDPVREIAEDLFEYTYPQEKDDLTLREEFVDDIVGKGVGYGEWFYFSWSQSLVRYAHQDVHRALRTSRNRDLITQEEQSKLYEGVAAVFGLSVGGSVVRQLALGGVAGTLITADMDVISPANTNRLEATQLDLGQKKIDVLAKYISVLDPYIVQILLRDGVDSKNIKEVMSDARPDFMVDAVDALPIKALIRATGKEYGVPVLMATDIGDRSLLDIEMYGKEEVTPFNGRLSEENYQKLLSGTATEDETKGFMFDLVGVENASERMLNSVMAVFSGELPGLPQLGATATIGGVAIERIAREILLGNEVTSGRSYIDTDDLLKRD